MFKEKLEEIIKTNKCEHEFEITLRRFKIPFTVVKEVFECIHCGFLKEFNPHHSKK